MAATAARVKDVVFEAEETLRWYHSTPTVEYGFCGTCGSTLFWRASDKPDHLSVTAGTLDPPTGLTTTLALFSAEASDYHRLDPAVKAVPYDRQLPSSDN